MAQRKTPTNADIYRTLGQIDEKLEQIHAQVKRTNGRVTVIEKWKESQEFGEAAVEAYKAKHPQTPQEKAEGWSVREKTLTAIITTLLAIMAALVGIKQL